MASIINVSPAVKKWECLQFTHVFNPLNAELNPICYLLALLGAHPILHVSRIRVKHLLNMIWTLFFFKSIRLYVSNILN